MLTLKYYFPHQASHSSVDFKQNDSNPRNTQIVCFSSPFSVSPSASYLRSKIKKIHECRPNLINKRSIFYKIKQKYYANKLLKYLIVLIENIKLPNTYLFMQNSKYQAQSQDRGTKNAQLLLSGTQSFKSSCSYLSNNSKLSSLIRTNSKWNNQISDQELNKKLCQIYLIVCQAFVTFLQKSPSQILFLQKPLIQTYAQQLSKVLDELSHIEEVDIISFGIFDQLIVALAQFLPKNQGQEINSICISQNTSEQNHLEKSTRKTQMKSKKECFQENQSQFKKSRTQIVQNISKMVYILFTGQNKQVHTNTILILDDDHQRIFMDLIMRQMKQAKNNNQNENNLRTRKHKKSDSFLKRKTQQIMIQKEYLREVNRKQKKTKFNSCVNQKPEEGLELQIELSKSCSKGSLFSKSSNNFSNFLSNSKSNQNLHENLKNLQLSKIVRCQSRFRFSLGNQESLELKSKNGQETKQLSDSNKNEDYECECHGKKVEERSQSLTQLINKILNLQDDNEKLIEQLESSDKKYNEMEIEYRQLLKINKKYESDNKELNYKISQLITQIRDIESHSAEEKTKIEKKLQKRIQIMEYHKKQQYKELSQINQSLHKNYQTKIQEFQQKLQWKRQKIVKLNQRVLDLEQELRTEKQKNVSKIEEIKYLNENINKKQERINELEIVKDTLSIEIQVWRSRLEDLRILLLCETQGRNKFTALKSKLNLEDVKNMKVPSQIAELSGQFQGMTVAKENLGTDNFQWGLTTNQWKKSSFRKLNLKMDVKHEGTGLRLNNNTKSQRQTENNQNEGLRLYLSYLKQKIDVLTKQNQQYIEELKQTRDLKYQKNKLVKTLYEHENYRGEQNQIILGCLYELIHESNEGQTSVMQECAQNEKLNERMKKIKEKRRSEKSMLSQRIEGKYQTFEVQKQILSQRNRWKQDTNLQQEYQTIYI